MHVVVSHSTALPPPRDDGQINLMFAIGGGKSIALLHSHLWKADGVVSLDVASEISQRPSPLRPPKMMRDFVLAEGETAGTMFAAHGPLRSRIDAFGDLNGAAGMGQLRLIGAKAAESLVHTEGFQQFMRSLLDLVLISSRGRPRYVRARVLGSVAGGTCSGACLPIVERMAHELVALEIPVGIEYDFLGATTFTGLGDRLGKNAASSLADQIESMSRKGEGRQRLITRSLALTELPPQVHDQAARDWLVIQDEQALASHELQQMLTRVAPNQAVNSALGNVTIRKTDFFTPLPQRRVTETVAEAYHGQLTQVIAQAIPNPALVRQVKVSVETSQQPHVSIETMAESIDEQAVDEVVTQLTVPTELSRAEVTVIGCAGEEYETARVAAMFSNPPQSLQEAYQRLRLLRSIVTSIEKELVNTQQKLAELEDSRSQQVVDVEKAMRSLLGWSLWTSLEKRLEKFMSLAQELRHLVNQLQRVNAWREALQLALLTFGREEEQLSERLRRMQVTFHQHCQKGGTDLGPSLILFRQLNDAFFELLDIDRAPIERQQQLLQLQASAATVDGLAHIVGVQPPRLERIANHIVHGRAPTEGPFWGGRPPQGESLLIYALPPLLPQVAEELREQIRKLDPNAVTVCADHCSAGVNVLRYRLYRVDRPQEVFRGRLGRDLQEAAQPENRQLFFPHGVPLFVESLCTEASSGPSANDTDAHS